MARKESQTELLEKDLFGGGQSEDTSKGALPPDTIAEIGVTEAKA